MVLVTAGSESCLPEELKNTTKTRLSYLQKHEIEKERQRLLQQQASVSRQESENREYSHSNGYGVGSASYQSEEPEITPSSIQSNESTEVQKTNRVRLTGRLKN